MATQKIQKRLPADKRRAVMLDAAAAYFAKHGLEATTRDIAGALGVTQALIYKHFASKEDLIESTLARVFAPKNQNAPWIDPAQPLEGQLLTYYTGLASASSEQRMRLFIRAGLDGRSWPTRRGNALTHNLFLPCIEGLRRLTNLPGLATTPPMRGERELAMMLHASIVFLGIRRHIYGMKMPRDMGDVVTLYVKTFMAGAVPAMTLLHAGGDDSLTVPLAVTPD